MSKVYNKIVQSNTEPSKNDIWLKDGQMKTFGKEGWKPVGGGVSEGNNESVGNIPELASRYNPETKEFKAKGSDLDIIMNNNFVILPLFWGYGSSGKTLYVVCETNIISSNSNLNTRYIKGSFVYNDEIYHIKLPVYGFDQTSIVIPEKYVSSYTFNYTEGKNSVTQDEYDGLKNAIENNQMILCKYHDANIPVTYGLNNGNIFISFTVEVSLFIFQITPSLELMENIRIFVTSDDLDVNALDDYLASLEERIAALEGNTTA